MRYYRRCMCKEATTTWYEWVWRDPHAPLICTTTLQRRNNARTRQIRITEEEEEVYPHVRHYIHHVVRGNYTNLYIWHSTITITNGDTWNILRLIAYCIVLLWLFNLSYPQCTSNYQPCESALIVTDYSTLHYHHFICYCGNLISSKVAVYQ